MRRLVLFTAALAALGVSVTAVPAAQAVISCQVTYSVTSQWTGGFQGSMALTDLGDPLNGWTLAFTFPDPGQKVTQGWNATWSQSGSTVTAASMSWNGSLATGASLTLGLIGSWTTSNPAPATFSLNGVTCRGSGTPTTSATSTSSTSTSTTARTTSTTRATTTSASGNCPASGHLTYTLSRAANPTSDQLSAYQLITTAMDQALAVYNCQTNITKALTVSYEPSVATADGSDNGSIRFGARSTMQQITAMHEISHTVGVGTYSGWASHLSGGVWTGSAATAELRAITGDQAAAVHGDSQHFWPYGLNYTSEVTSSADLVDHCRMVVALRRDMGL